MYLAGQPCGGGDGEGTRRCAEQELGVDTGPSHCQAACRIRLEADVEIACYLTLAELGSQIAETDGLPVRLDVAVHSLQRDASRSRRLDLQRQLCSRRRRRAAHLSRCGQSSADDVEAAQRGQRAQRGQELELEP